MRVVPCTRDYWEFVRRLRTDPRNAHGFISQSPISVEQHAEFMERHWQSYLIAVDGFLPVGYAGSVAGDIRVCVDADHQRHGIGRILLEHLVRQFPESVARVKAGNEASLALFRSCGFKPTLVTLERHGR